MLSLALFIFVAFLMLFLGGAVLVHDVRKKSNRYFFAFTMTTVIWMIFNFLENVSRLSLPWRGLFLHLDFSVAILAAAFLFLFVYNFPDYKSSLKKDFIVLVPALVVSIGSLSSLMLTRVFLMGERINFLFGPMFYIYAIFLIGFFVGSFIFLLIRHKQGTESEKKQVRIVTIGLFLSLLISVTMNLFLQNYLDVEVFRFGIYAFIFFTVSVAIAIIRHEFLRVRFVLVEILLLGVLSILLTRIFLSKGVIEILISTLSFVAMLVLGFMLVKSVLLEVSHRQELEILTDKLEKSNTKLKKLDKAKTEFLSIASHELRTPLSVIRGYMSMIGEGSYGKFTKKQLEVTEKISMSADRLINLVNQLLDVSRIESGRTTVELQAVRLYPLIKSTVDFMKNEADQKGLKLTLEKAPKGLPLVVGDPGKLKEIITNLVGNAIKYTLKGSVRVSVHREKNMVQVDVQDSGVGLRKSDISELFQKFARASTAQLSRAKGTGLGLYVVKKYVVAMGGDMWVKSPGVNKGSVFSFTLKIDGKKGRKKIKKIVK